MSNQKIDEIFLSTSLNGAAIITSVNLVVWKRSPMIASQTIKICKISHPSLTMEVELTDLRHVYSS